MDIVLIANGICILLNVVIINPIRADFVLWTISSQGMAMMIIIKG